LPELGDTRRERESPARGERGSLRFTIVWTCAWKYGTQEACGPRDYF